MSDGTAAGTVLLANINPGTPGSTPNFFTPFRGELYFSALTAANGRELWKTDGTAVGTMMVADIFPGTGSGSPS